MYELSITLFLFAIILIALLMAPARSLLVVDGKRYRRREQRDHETARLTRRQNRIMGR